MAPAREGQPSALAAELCPRLSQVLGLIWSHKKRANRTLARICRCSSDFDSADSDGCSSARARVAGVKNDQDVRIVRGDLCNQLRQFFVGQIVLAWQAAVIAHQSLI